MARRKTLTMSVRVDDQDGGFTELQTSVAFDSSYFPTLVDALNEFGPNMFDELMGGKNAKSSTPLRERIDSAPDDQVD